MDLRYHGTQITAPATFQGRAGAAWRVTMATLGSRGRPDLDATLDCFLLRCPDAHPCWDHWAISVIHLRPIAGVKPAHVRVPGATHELMIIALNPEEPLPGLDASVRGWRLAFLTPIDIMEQFVSPNGDLFAQHLLELSVRAIVDGFLSPDQDYRAAWQKAITDTAAHYTDGTHTMPRPA